MTKPRCAIDLETKGLIEKGKVPEIVCWSYADDECSGASQDIDLLVHKLKTITPVFHNAKFDVSVLFGHGIIVKEFEDTMLLSYVVDTTQEHSLKAWGKKLGHKKLDFDMTDANNLEWSDELAEYAKVDTEVTWKLWGHLRTRLTDADVERIYRLELAMCQVIMEFERVGLPVDLELAYDYHGKLTEEINNYTARILEICPIVPCKKLKEYKKEHPEHEDKFVKTVDGIWYYQFWEDFNPNSRHHKAYALKQLGWKPNPKKISKDGTPVVDADVMKDLAHVYPIADYFSKIAKSTKTLNTFVKALIENRDERGFVHGNINQAITRTGRLSSSNPNLQNLPSKGETGDKIRTIVASPHPKLDIVGGDLSNIEARVLGYYLWRNCGDPSMVEIFRSGADLHQSNADNWGLTRGVAKTVLYLTLYGGTYQLLARRANISESEAKGIFAMFEKNCPSVPMLKEKVWSYTRKFGYIKTVMGRKLYYPEINSKNRAARGRAERQVFNALLQGSAADIIKHLTVAAYPVSKKLGALNIIQVHDEIMYLVHNEKSKELAKEVGKVWNSCKILDPMPVTADFQVGRNWYDVH